MGLDWHSSVRMTCDDQEAYVRRYYGKELANGQPLDDLMDLHAPTYDKPCALVGALKMKDLPDFRDRMWRYLADKRQQAALESKADPKIRNQTFIDHWQDMRLEHLMALEGDKFCCDECPLIRDLHGADSQGSFFIGITVSSCDFRGKRIGADPELGDLSEEAFTEHDPDEMLDYAERLEQRLEELQETGLLQKDPYSRYEQNHRNDPFAKVMGEPQLSRADYEKTLHWREQNIRDAVHWLRTCASQGIHMATSY